MSGGIPACSCRRLFQAFQILQAGCPHLERASMKNRNYKEQERARPSGTHSSEVPLRTRPEYAPKDAPKLGTSFACTCSMQNLSGVSREPLQRITLNRTARGVAARLGPPSSLPIAPTRTTPEPAKRSIAQSKRDGTENFPTNFYNP